MSDSAAEPAPDSRAVRIRRAPKLGAFAVLGIVVGAIVGLVVGLAFPDSDSLSRGQGTGIALAFAVPSALALSLLVYVVLDWRSRRRAGSAQAEVAVLSPEPPAAEPAGAESAPPEPGQVGAP